MYYEFWVIAFLLSALSLLYFAITETITQSIDSIVVQNFVESDFEHKPRITTGESPDAIVTRIKGTFGNVSRSSTQLEKSSVEYYLGNTSLPESISSIKKFIDKALSISIQALSYFRDNLTSTINSIIVKLRRLFELNIRIYGSNNYEVDDLFVATMGVVGKKDDLEEFKPFVYEYKVGFLLVDAPKVIFKNESKTVRLEIVRAEPGIIYPEQLKVKGILLETQDLEVKLIASGVEIDGEKTYRVPFKDDRYCFYWNCFFNCSGKQEMTFKVSFLDSLELNSNNAKIIDHEITVKTFMGLTDLQIFQLSLGLGSIGFVGTFLQLVELIRNLNE